MSSRPPIIIIGMSRSGTGILAKMLEDLGLFIGKSKDRNHEAWFFIDLNMWLLEQSSGGLENPQAIKYLLKDKEARTLFAKFASYTMKTPKAISYLGLKKYLSCRTPANLDIPWGWKDPRNTITLPFWLDIFPDAKVIHIYRHGVDVANSLRVSQDKGLQRLRIKDSLYKNLYWYYLVNKFIPNRKKFIYLRCASLYDGISMWEEYVNMSRGHVESLKGRAIEIKYEDMMLQPSAELETLAQFCDLNTTDRDILQASRLADKSRAYAYINNTELKEFAENKTIKKRLKALGY
ncbi:MAG: sulfotransferase [Candidatus Dadabacteria bacterium]|nr:sulfotransferase [Candidatus Dadabacteria bacterium]NIS09903.1 sulfotransferase [Candidatus Dadabacteria bacterium]NIV41732.1 hypothetical protein [Candidatus Dadabacteria bacterium]NIX16328.1 hypothetical protein [Candidatus Dadabacteria bacterium]NIY21149.1 hypothetical protein [Candidatus Dadabacteria bacterium]